MLVFQASLQCVMQCKKINADQLFFLAELFPSPLSYQLPALVVLETDKISTIQKMIFIFLLLSYNLDNEHSTIRRTCANNLSFFLNTLGCKAEVEDLLTS